MSFWWLPTFELKCIQSVQKHCQLQHRLTRGGGSGSSGVSLVSMLFVLLLQSLFLLILPKIWPAGPTFWANLKQRLAGCNRHQAAAGQLALQCVTYHHSLYLRSLTCYSGKPIVYPKHWSVCCVVCSASPEPATEEEKHLSYLSDSFFPTTDHLLVSNFEFERFSPGPRRVKHLPICQCAFK